MPEQGKMISGGAGILLIAEAIKVLASSVKLISDLSWAEIAKGMAGVAALLLAMGLFTRFAQANNAGILSGAGIILIATAVKILGSAMKDLSGMDWNQLAKGMTGVVVGLIAMAGAMKLMPSGGVLKGAGIVEVSAAMKILASAIKDMSGMSWIEIGKGMTVMAGGLGAIVLAMKLMSPTDILSATGLVIAVAGLKILASAMKDMASMSWGDIAKSLVELLGALTLLSLALIAMEGSLPGAAALIVAAGGLLCLGATSARASSCFLAYSLR
jgi:hypothetical protein